MSCHVESRILQKVRDCDSVDHDGWVNARRGAALIMLPAFYALATAIHVLVLIKVIPFTWVNGGRSNSFGEQAVQSGLSIGILVALALVAFRQARKAPSLSKGGRALMWCLVALWLVGLVQQLLGTTFELWVMFPIVALGLVGHLLVAMSRSAGGSASRVS